MGYRSDVKSVIYGDKATLDAFIVSTKLRHAGETLDWIIANCEVHELLGNEAVLLLQVDNVKWYPEYPETELWDTLCTEAVERGLCWEFVRIGEEYEDIEYEAGAPDHLRTTGLLSVHRSIAVNF